MGQNLITYNDLWGTQGATAPPFAGFVVGANINTTTPQTGTVGNWSTSATGRSQLGLSAGIPILDIGTRAQTSVNNGNLNFGIDNRAAVGALNIDNLLGAGVGMAWSASYHQTGFAWGNNQTLYTYTALVQTSSGLLNDIATLDSSFTFAVRDGAGNVIQTLSGNTFLNALGIQIANDGTLLNLSPTNQYNLNTSFLGGNHTAGLFLDYSANSLLDTSLLGLGNTVLQVSDISLTATAVPEPTAAALAAFGLGAAALRRRRRD